MKDEYDFSRGRRGKFYRPNVKFNMPVYLDADVFDYPSTLAKAKSVEIGDRVNKLLRKDIDLIESMK